MLRQTQQKTLYRSVGLRVRSGHDHSRVNDFVVRPRRERFAAMLPPYSRTGISCAIVSTHLSRVIGNRSSQSCEKWVLAIPMIPSEQESRRVNKVLPLRHVAPIFSFKIGSVKSNKRLLDSRRFKFDYPSVLRHYLSNWTLRHWRGPIFGFGQRARWGLRRRQTTDQPLSTRTQIGCHERRRRLSAGMIGVSGRSMLVRRCHGDAQGLGSAQPRCSRCVERLPKQDHKARDSAAEHRLSVSVIRRECRLMSDVVHTDISTFSKYLPSILSSGSLM